ncbi:hypothetical protein MYE70_10715 [Marinobacter alexandrii]|uniref:hypothetical protein n=1 Tax=Marinobacter alexandrii TaxID=2570351 RepID=UPI001FFFE021|nr:hypothetical protein [Marinobacter alexandrii]MCK2149538.1 hypothetical protein [Marinobacter alexandrii]
MAIQDFPANISPDAEEWKLTYNTLTFESDLNGAMQTAELPGARWSVSMTFSNRQGKAARALQGFLAGLKGRAGRVWVIPVDWEPLGTPDGAGAVSADTSGGTSLPTNGWDADIIELFCAGDYFEVNGELKKLTATISSDALGQATLQFAPPLRQPVTIGMSIRVIEPRCQMLLSSDDQATWSMSAPKIYATTISGREALDI